MADVGVNFSVNRHIIHGFLLLVIRQVLVNADGCPESNATVKVVPGCPQTQEAWTEAAVRKKCGGIPHSCPSFVYHCVMNTWQNETVEVCAPTSVTVGKKCAEYNYGGSRVQRNEKTNCNKCPDVYTSDESFQYPECYQVRPEQPSTEPEVTTSSLLSSDDGTTTNRNVPPTSSVTKEQSTNQNQHSDGSTKTNEDRLETVWIILGIIAAAAVFIVLVIVTVIYWKKRRQKYFKCCKIGGQQEKTNLSTPAENKNRNGQQDRTWTNDQTEEEQTMLDNPPGREHTVIDNV